jgi:NOL1/NOP2/fmu family ribosome biogenesis protein
MLVYQVLQQYGNKNFVILDLCAAPGGKSSLMASWLENQGCLVANEVIKSRAYTLKTNLAKDAYQNVIVTNSDPQAFGKMQAMFDMIFIDAPCSGEGMFRKDKSSITEWSLENVQLCSARQKRILSDVLPCLKKDGLIVYSTCTFNKHENIENIRWLQDKFGLQGLPMALDPSWGIMSYETPNFYAYQCLPSKVKGEGLFISVLQKNEETDKIKFSKDKAFQSPDKKQDATIRQWIKSPKDLATILVDKASNVHALNSEIEPLARDISNYVKIISTGITVGTFNKEIIIPDQALAWSDIINEDISTAELNFEEALAYLRKELESISSSTKSWHVVRYKGLGIGWLKNLGNRINNYLPNDLRVIKK